MLFRILKYNATAGYLLIPLLTVIAWWPSLSTDSWQQMAFDLQPMPLFELVRGYIPANSLISKIIAMAFLMVIGFYLINFNSRYIIISERTLLPTFFFILIISSLTTLQRMNPALLSMAFFLPAVNKLLSSYKTERLSYNFFEASFLIGAGSLLYFNLVYFIILVWVALLILRPVIWREWAFSILGVVTPWAFFVTGYFLIHDTFAPALELIKFDFALQDTFHLIGIPLQVYFSFLLLLLIPASSHIVRSINKMKVLPRKIFVLFFWTFILAAAIFFLIDTANIEMIIHAALPIAFLLSHFLLSMRSGFWRNLVLWLMVAGLQVIAWLPVII